MIRLSHERAESLALRARLIPAEPVPPIHISYREAVGVRLYELEPGHSHPDRPAFTRGEAHPAFASGTGSSYPAFVLEVDGGRVVTEAGIVVSAEAVLEETAWDREQLDRMLPPGALVRRRRAHSGSLASLISRWHDNYFHWILGVLPRFAQLERAGLANLPLLVPARMGRTQMDSLRQLGIDSSRLVAFRPPNVQAGRLIWPAPAGHTGRPMPWACDWLRHRFVGNRVKRLRRLYISRSRAHGRRIVDEERLVGLLAPVGFDVVRPELLSFAEQVRTFAAAEAVVAPHGSGLTNLVFASSAAVVELFEPAYVNPCYFALSQSCGHRYWYAIGRRRGRDNIEVEPELVIETVEAALAQAE